MLASGPSQNWLVTKVTAVYVAHVWLETCYHSTCCNGVWNVPIRHCSRNHKHSELPGNPTAEYI